MTRRRNGFILVLVLWVLLALTIAAAALAAWVARTTDQALLLADERRGQIDAADTLETLKFLFATRPWHVDGLFLAPMPDSLVNQWRSDPFGEHRFGTHPANLPLDDTLMAGLGSARLRIQDESGLVAIQSLDFSLVGGLLGQAGATRLRQNDLSRALSEYILTDALGISGRALAAEYRAAGLPPPPGRYPISPLEALNVPGWRWLAEAGEIARWRDGAGVLARGGLNANTAPVWVLAAASDVSSADAQRLVSERTLQPLRGNARIPGIDLDPFRYSYLPGNAVRLTLGTPSSRRSLRYHLRLTPQAHRQQPWQVELNYPVAQPSEPATLESVQPRPISHPLFAAPE